VSHNTTRAYFFSPYEKKTKLPCGFDGDGTAHLIVSALLKSCSIQRNIIPDDMQLDPDRVQPPETVHSQGCVYQEFECGYATLLRLIGIR
jgi:hypothetical protein